MRRVLIVDNHPPLLRSLEVALRHYGLDVAAAASVADAQAKLMTVTVHVVLTDYDLGVGTGLDVLRETLVSQPAARRALMSGGFPDDLSTHAASGLVQRAFDKPFLLLEVASWIRTGRV